MTFNEKIYHRNYFYKIKPNLMIFGDYVSWYNNGNLFEKSFLNIYGKYHGYKRIWTDSGKLMSSERYCHGTLVEHAYL